MSNEPFQFQVPNVETRHMKDESLKRQMIDDDIAQIDKALASLDENEVKKYIDKWMVDIKLVSLNGDEACMLIILSMDLSTTV